MIPMHNTRRRQLLSLFRLLMSGLIAFCVMDFSTPILSAQDLTKKTKAATPRSDDEPIALAFVRENHPELAELLAQLKPTKPTEYEKAIRDLAQVSRTLRDLEERDPKRFQLGLDAWKTRSKVDLLAARLANSPIANPELESQLRVAIEAQIDQEIVRLEAERTLAEERLEKVKNNLERTKSRHDQIVQNRYKARLETAEKARKKSTSTKVNVNATETKPKPPTDKGKDQP